MTAPIGRVREREGPSSKYGHQCFLAIHSTSLPRSVHWAANNINHISYIHVTSLGGSSTISYTCFHRHPAVVSFAPVIVPFSSPRIRGPSPSLAFNVGATFPVGSNSSLPTVTFTRWCLPTTIHYDVLSQHKTEQVKWTKRRVQLTPSLPSHLSANLGTRHSSMTSSAVRKTSSNVNISLASSLSLTISR